MAMKNRAVEFYIRLYSSEVRAPLVPNLNIYFDDAISVEMSAWMRRYPTLKEIKDILHNRLKGKLPCPDGQTAEVLVHHWSTIREVLVVILYFF